MALIFRCTQTVYVPYFVRGICVRVRESRTSLYTTNGHGQQLLVFAQHFLKFFETSLADPWGDTDGTCPPKGPDSFVLTNKFLKRGHIVSCHPSTRFPPTGNPGSATGRYLVFQPTTYMVQWTEPKVLYFLDSLKVPSSSPSSSEVSAVSLSCNSFITVL